MEPAEHAWAAADHVFELLHRLEADALLGDDLLEVKRFAECAAEVLPHRPGDALALDLRKLGESPRKVAERAFLPVQARGDQPPGEAGSRRCRLERQCRRGCLSGPKYAIFQPVTQRLEEGHGSARDRRPAEAGDCAAARVSVKPVCRCGPI
jgi:hypothetical protein